MSGIADRRLEERVVERLTVGPAEISELFAALRARDASVLAGQEGSLHGLVHRLVKDRVIAPAGHAANGGTIYELTASRAPVVHLEDATPRATPPRDAPPPASGAAVLLATRIARAARDPADRGRVVADVLAHHAALARDDAAWRFGPWKLARSVLGRVDRGRPVLGVAENGWEKLKRFAMLEGPALVTTLVVLLVVWLFVAEFRVIPSNSMQPALRPGDRLVVRKLGGKSLPPRFQMAVFHGAKDVLVKRVVGLPGETVLIDNGDVLIDGVRVVKPEDLSAEVREPVWRTGSGSDADWTPIGGTSPVERRLSRALFADEPHYRDPRGKLEDVRTPRPLCHDVYLTATASGVAALGLEFVGEAENRPPNDMAAVAWRRTAAGAEVVTLRRGAYAPKGEVEVLAEASGTENGQVTIAVIDGVLWVDSARLHVRRPLEIAKGHVRPVSGGAVADVSIDRDIHYTSDVAAAFAVDMPYRVPDGHVFLLGDHSSNSRDCRFREVGPIPLERLIGPVIFRVWPPHRIGVPR